MIADIGPSFVTVGETTGQIIHRFDDTATGTNIYRIGILDLDSRDVKDITMTSSSSYYEYENCKFLIVTTIHVYVIA